MKEEKWYKSPKIFKIISVVLLIICVLMTGLYFLCTICCSGKSMEWANFGQYFGSITGLLAFAGVLYSAALSEERANRVEEEVRKREERDLFFKMLDLYQNSVKTVYKNNSSGLSAFHIFTEITNRYLVSYGAVFKMMKNEFDYNKLSEYEKEVGSTFINEILIKASREPGIPDELRNCAPKLCAIYCSQKKLKEDDGLIESINAISNSYFSLIKGSLTDNEKLEIFKFVSKLIYIRYLKIFDSYFRNIYQYLKILASFLEYKEYLNIFMSQLSNDEIFMILIYSLSGKATEEDIKYLEFFRIFKILRPEDIVFINEKNAKSSDVNHLIKELLNGYKQSLNEKIV